MPGLVLATFTVMSALRFSGFLPGSCCSNLFTNAHTVYVFPYMTFQLEPLQAFIKSCSEFHLIVQLKNFLICSTNRTLSARFVTISSGSVPVTEMEIPTRSVVIIIGLSKYDAHPDKRRTAVPKQEVS